MPQLIHFGRQEKTFVPKGPARTSPPHASPEQFGCALLSATLHRDAARRIAAAEGDGEQRRITNELRE
jgi:hypothetical protein